MARLFTIGGVCIDVAGTVVSSAMDRSDVGLIAWITFSLLLLALPIAWQIAEPMLTAGDVPEVLTLEEPGHVG